MSESCERTGPHRCLLITHRPVICERCGHTNFIDNDGPSVCTYCFRTAMVAVTHPEMLSPMVVKLLEMQHPGVVLGYELGSNGAMVRVWRFA